MIGFFVKKIGALDVSDYLDLISIREFIFNWLEQIHLKMENTTQKNAVEQSNNWFVQFHIMRIFVAILILVNYVDMVLLNTANYSPGTVILAKLTLVLMPLIIIHSIYKIYKGK